LVQNATESNEKVSNCKKILEKHLFGKTNEQQEHVFRQLLKFASAIENHTRMKWLFDIFHQFIENKTLSARLLLVPGF
jgi:sugar phosphate isomerase/epimerase